MKRIDKAVVYHNRPYRHPCRRKFFHSRHSRPRTSQQCPQRFHFPCCDRETGAHCRWLRKYPAVHRCQNRLKQRPVPCLRLCYPACTDTSRMNHQRADDRDICGATKIIKVAISRDTPLGLHHSKSTPNRSPFTYRPTKDRACHPDHSQATQRS